MFKIVEELIRDDFFNNGPVRVIYLYNPDCHTCNEVKNLNLISDLKELINRDIFEIKIDYPPLFAPSVLPAFIIYSNGARFAELSIYGSFEDFKIAFESCINDAKLNERI